MTERAPASAPAKQRRPGGVLIVAWASCAMFLMLLALLAARMGAGADPALRARSAAASLPARRVLVRRIYERRVIVHLPSSAALKASRSSSQVSSSGAFGSTQAVTRTS